MRKSLVCLMVVGAAVSLCAMAQDLDGQPVGEIRIQGLDRVSEQLVRSHIEAKVGEPFNPRALARDIRRLYDLGFFSNIQTESTLESGKVVLTFSVQEKQFIEEIKIVGNKKVRQRQIRGVLSWQEGDTFVSEAYTEELEAIRKLYREKGYPNATADITVEEISPSRVRIIYTLTEGKKAKIQSISFEGNEVITDRKLRKLMKTKRGWWFVGGKYDEDKFEADLQAVVDEYGNRGRLEAAVDDVDFAYGPSGKDLDITITLSEGPEYHVETLNVAGNEVFDNDEIERIIDVHTGDTHNKGQVQEDARLIQQGYSDSGYIEAGVTPQVTLDREKKTTHIVYRVDEQGLKYVREVEVTGNTVTKDEVIRRAVMLSPGDRFDGTSVKNSERLLDNTSFFEEVRIFPRLIDGEDQFADLMVDVEEGKTGNFNFGLGYSTEEQVTGFAELKLNNFDIGNWPSFSGGGQQFAARISLGSKRSQYNINFTDPQIAGYPVSFGFDLFDESVDYTDGTEFSQDTQGGQIRFGKALSPFVTARSYLRFENIDIGDIPLFASREWREQRGGSTTFSTIWGINRNTVDSRKDPSLGASHDLEAELAGLGGDNHFYKLQHDSSWYRPLGDTQKWVVSFQTRQGWVNEYGSSEFVPIAYRFFAGGPTTVRGYETRDIGPTERRFVLFGEEERVGGELRVLNSVELKYKLTDKVRFYTFTDSGGVWVQASDFDPGDIKYSMGIGLGVALPVLLIVLMVKMLRGTGSSGSSNEEEARLMQEIAYGLRRMEDRIEALETILLDKVGKEGGK